MRQDWKDAKAESSMAPAKYAVGHMRCVLAELKRLSDQERRLFEPEIEQIENLIASAETKLRGQAR